MKYYFWILGCAMNYSDAERMATVLDSLGYTRTENEKETDIFVVIACSVRESAVLSIYGKVRDLKAYKSQNPKFRTVLAGCVLEKDRKKLSKIFDVIFDIKDLDKLPELLGEKRMGLSGEYLTITPHYESHFRAFVPISIGCNNFCSYCAVPYTRGREKSRPAGEIIDEVQDLVGKGYTEITLLGQNVNSYGHDITGNANNNSPFISLISEIDEIPGEYRVYFYSNHPKDMTDDLIHAISKLKHFPRYIHLPLQSGNDEILRQMNRHNTKSDYLELVERIREIMPDVTLTTDIIVGYPGETEDQFKDTAAVMRKAEYDMAFIAQYSPRPGTVSAKQSDNVSKEEKKRREDLLQQILAETVLKHNTELVGTTQRVLIDEQKNGKYYGRTEGFKVVEILPSRHSEFISESSPKKTLKQVQGDVKIGQFIDVKIESASSWKLFGRTLG